MVGFWNPAIFIYWREHRKDIMKVVSGCGLGHDRQQSNGVFKAGRLVASSYYEFLKYFPSPAGWNMTLMISGIRQKKALQDVIKKVGPGMSFQLVSLTSGKQRSCGTRSRENLSTMLLSGRTAGLPRNARG